MNPNREELLFQLALTKPATDRAAFLERECAGDAALRARLEALLAAHDAPDELIPAAKPGAKATIKLELEDAPDEVVGQKIGRYKILERIGEGGCGVVYVAEQTEPVRRRVALKVIKLGMDTKQVVARFEAERQALAMMDHPNIAKVLDAGTTETGRPYFVMELVRGIRITDYCDQNNLSTKERLDLFIKVCQAIQHAHQKGIIHRDIKPSNILVTLHDGVPVPKVIDFGIAKATEGRLTDATVYTQLNQFIGTPAYMSPEQAEMSGLDIDTRSDIYSLGVLLYELLTGKTPFDADELMASGIDQMRKTIREKDPLRPSTKLATLKGEELTTTAKRRSVDRSKLLYQLKGDLDWIVMKCLEKDRMRRYDTATGLAADIKRHLNMEPVVACPPSKFYEFQKTVRRHKFGFAATAAIIIVLTVGVLVSTWQAVRATHATREALAAQAQAVTAQGGETKLRQQAEAEELAARQRAYASDMNVAQQALDGNNLGRALDLLNRQRPQPGQKDLRGWEWRYLWQQTRSDALYTLCHKSEIESLAVSADGRWLAVGLVHRGGLFVYDLQTRQQVGNLAPDERDVRAAFSPVGSLLAFASSKIPALGKTQTTLHLWDAATEHMVAEIPLENTQLFPTQVGLAFSQDGRTLVTCTDHLTLWRVSDAARLASYPCEQRYYPYESTGFAITPDLGLAAYVSRGGQIRVMDLRSGKELWTSVVTKEVVLALAFSPDGKILASADGYSESNIYLWDVPTGKEIGKLEGYSSWGSLVFLADGKKLASASADQTIRIWDVASRKCLDVLRGHRSEVWRLALLPDGKTLVSGCKDGTVCFWDTSVTHARQPRIILSDDIVLWQFAPDSQSVLTFNKEGQLSRWSGPDFQQKETILETGTNNYYRSSGYSYGNLISQDGRFLAVGGTNGILRVWDVSRRVLAHQLSIATTGEEYPINFLADGNTLLTGSESGNAIHEWDLTTGVEIQSWQVPADSMADVSPDGQYYLAEGDDGDSLFRNLTGKSNTSFQLDVLEVAQVCYSPDGKLIAFSSDLGYVRIFDAVTWRSVTTLGGFMSGVHGVAFSSDGQRLLTCNGNAEALKVWATDSWQDVLTLEGQGDGHFMGGGVGFSPDGNIAGWQSAAGDLNLWRAPSWDEINAAEAKDQEQIQQP
ncbi:MAG TPA: serine/threonine-protein kinase [Verrucomicrobiae bacterium]|jgi:WD40 repeat protein